MTTLTPATAEIAKWLRVRVRFFTNFLLRIRVRKKNAKSCRIRLRHSRTMAIFGAHGVKSEISQVGNFAWHRVQIFFKFENTIPVQAVSTTDATEIQQCFYLKNYIYKDHGDSYSWQKWQATLDPVSSKISDLILFVSYFASQNKKKFDNCFFGVCYLN